ncbi:MAG TPA: hypothetical protein VNL98_06760 [Gemmatimonadales bacterium]|nr:hypothetical protein [Gemmatimonadales bacterium]
MTDTAYDPAQDPHLERARKWCPSCETEYMGWVWRLLPVIGFRQLRDAAGRVIALCDPCIERQEARERAASAPRPRAPSVTPLAELTPPREAGGWYDDPF